MTNAELRDRLNQHLNEFPPTLLRVVFEFVEFLAQRQQATRRPAAPPESQSDPLIGLFSGSPTLATDAEEMLQQGLEPGSGWTWKQR